MISEEKNLNVKHYLKKLNGRINIRVIFYQDYQAFIITRGSVGKKNNPNGFYQTNDFSTRKEEQRIGSNKSHLRSTTSLIKRK